MHPGVLLALAGVVAIFLLVWFFGRGLGVPPPVDDWAANNSPDVHGRDERTHSENAMPDQGKRRPLGARLSDPQRLHDLVANSGQEDAWICFFAPRARPDDEAVHLQFSMENGRPGFDWVLLAPANVRDQAKFEALAESIGIELQRNQINGVDYFRTEDERCVELCRRIVVDIYGGDENTILDTAADNL